MACRKCGDDRDRSIDMTSRSTSSVALRQRFLAFFQQRGHEVVRSSPLIPANDPTLLFTNAGMVQFKETFLGQEKRPYQRATSSQRCVRAGGKHNDLENVGYTARHHTFFEMLGNFSFGDYFKREAIAFAWEFLTAELAIDPARLWVTVFDEDDEAAKIWLDEVGIDPARFSRLGAEDNFWSMGDTGPCGPCTEIFFDHGADVAGGPPGTPDADGDRYVEIWNLVFMQYNRDSSGKMTELPHPSVDTGMGLERLVAVMQGVHSNYEIDLFQRLIAATAEVTAQQDTDQPSLRVIADHIRSTAFLIVDGVIPSNEGRGYVLRRIIRRAIRHGYRLGVKKPFFHRLVAALTSEMGEAYPELAAAETQVERVIRQEEGRFAETLEQGMQILEQAIASLEGKTIAGETLFRLYDTYGFPVDLTADIARERSLQVDLEGFEAAMAEQRARARSAGSFASDYGALLAVNGESQFTGYDRLHDCSPVMALFRGQNAVSQLDEGDEGVIVLAQTPFYAESGGQVGDSGILRGAAGEFAVSDCQKQPGGGILHIGKLIRGRIEAAESLTAEVNQRLRQAIAVHHSATHLMHAALRHILGEHVAQKGSLVDPQRLRFDFSHFEAVTTEQLLAVEEMVNEQIRANHAVITRVMGFDEARDSGAMALFGEKYGDQVRVLSMGDFSLELCGGTHVERTGDIGLFKITVEAGVAAGVRRIEALAGAAALSWVNEGERQLQAVGHQLKGSRSDIVEKVGQLVQRQRQLEKELDKLKGKLASSAGSDLASAAVDVGGCQLLAVQLEGADPRSLRDTVDQLKNKLKSAAVVLATINGSKVALVAGVTDDWHDKISAVDLVNHVAVQVGGKGGGRADMAQAGGSTPAGLALALDSVEAWLRGQLDA